MGAAVHPIVAHHPVTGKPFLYVNRHFTTHVLGMSSGDSQRLLTALFDHINQPDFQVRFRWHARDGGAVGQPCHPALCRRRLPAPVSLYASRHGGQRSTEPQYVTVSVPLIALEVVVVSVHARVPPSASPLR